MSRLKVSLLMLGVVLLISCGDDSIVRQSVQLDPSGWSAEDLVEFEFEIKDTEQAVNMFVDLRHNGEYPYRNLFLFFELEAPDGTIAKDTLECLLADKLGHWKGSGNGFVFSNAIEHDIMFRFDKKFPEKGIYKVRLEQAMREEKLVGILDLGIAIRPNVK